MPTATMVITPMLAHPTAITALTGSWVASSSAPGPGSMAGAEAIGAAAVTGTTAEAATVTGEVATVTAHTPMQAAVGMATLGVADTLAAELLDEDRLAAVIAAVQGSPTLVEDSTVEGDFMAEAAMAADAGN